MRPPPSHLYLEIAESIRRRIASGELEPGQRLPPVRQMARRWACTPGTVGRAYATLAEEGLLETRRGGGTLVTPNLLQPYRPIWRWAALVNQAEQYLLTAVGQGHDPEQATAALSLAVSRWRDLQRQGMPPERVEPAGQATLRFAGSHDLLVESLAQIISSEPAGYRLAVNYSGSLGGLMALAQGSADVAGIHLWDQVTDSYNLPFVRRLLPGRRLVMLNLAHRSLGLIVPAGNPQRIAGLADLDRPDGRLVNRQPGSGTRVWLDAQLVALGIDAPSISGYDHEELTHLAVARAVMEGEATMGLGICAAAEAYGLGFVPLTLERYDLVIPEAIWHSASMQSLVRQVRSDSFKQALTSLGGYDPSETGQETWIS